MSRREAMKAGAAGILTSGMLSLGTRIASAADPYADAILVDGEPPMPEKGSFTVAVLPDTQNYSEFFPDSYVAQTTWIRDNRERRNIACVLHLGDITNKNTPAEWENAQRAMRILDGQVPYFLTPGNHDYSKGGVCSDRTTLLNEYFPASQFRDQKTFGATYDKEPDRLENAYYRFAANSRQFLVIALEFGPRRDVVRWANEVVAKHPDHEAILITHAYLYSDSTRYNWAERGPSQKWNPHSYGVAKSTGGDVLDGEQLWQSLIVHQPNFIMTLNGHVLNSGLGHLVTPAAGSREVHQVLVNFQMKPKGGDGWLRLLEFKADGKTVQSYDYSPTRHQRNESPANQFAMTLSAVS